ncbi:YaaR family protein [Bacillus sp. JJ634]
MDVQRISKATLNAIQGKGEVAKDSIHFQAMMDKKRQETTYDRLTKKVAEIESQGKKLADNHSVENLRKYKKMVKEFMEDAVKNGLELTEHRGFNQRGSTKVYKLVKEVDKKLIDLTNEVLDKEKKGLGILNIVGEIKGMLINIYT